MSQSRSNMDSLVTNPRIIKFQLPTDLILEILSRLPVKTLLRFTSVCKSWKSLIESPVFISKHLKQYPLNPNLTLSTIVAATGGMPYYNPSTSCYLEYSLNEPLELDLSFLGKTDYVQIVGVSNGLLCLFILQFSWKFAICNPATKQHHHVPDLESRDKEWLKENGEEILGFGFHPNTNDHQLIRILDYYDEPIIRAEIYSMNNDCWRVVNLEKNNIYFELPCLGPVMLNGTLYWVARNEQWDRFILAFNIDHEILQLIETPQCIHDTEIAIDISYLKEEVAILSHSYEDKCIDVWVLVADGNSWVWKYKTRPILPRHALIVGRAKNGDVIVKSPSKLIFYDVRLQEMKILPISLMSGCIYKSYTYVESLLPVKKNKQLSNSEI